MTVVLSPHGPADGPPDLQGSAGLPPQVCQGCGPAASEAPIPGYFEYNSTISCSCTGRLICSRVGIETTRPVVDAGSNESHSGMPRPLTSSFACSMAGFFWLRGMTVMTSPCRTEYDGI